MSPAAATPDQPPLTAVFSATASITVVPDQVSGVPTVTLPVIVLSNPTAGQAIPGDDIAVRAHPDQWSIIVDGNTGLVIDAVKPATTTVYVAGQTAKWQLASNRLLAGPVASTPLNVLSPFQWIQVTCLTPTGPVTGKLGLFQ
jgi:hypothetical protein